jgi:cholesterol transport system auxiliary component
MKKLILISIFSILFNSCGSKEYYFLSISSNPKIVKKTSSVIGITRVVIPEYLYKQNIYIASSSSKIKILSSAIWAEDLDKGLTHRLISFLQKKFNSANIFTYPWGSSKNPNKVLRVEITKFISQNSIVYLEANWKIENIKTLNVKTNLFRTSIPTTNKAEDIVKKMNILFTRLEERISLDL